MNTTIFIIIKQQVYCYRRLHEYSNLLVDASNKMSADHGKYNSIFTLTVDTAIKILSLVQVSDSLEINSPYTLFY